MCDDLCGKVYLNNLPHPAFKYKFDNFDKKVYDIIMYYQKLVRECMGKPVTFFKKGDPRKNPKFKKFREILKICEEEEFEPKEYIDVQFNYFKYYTNLLFPQPGHLCSENAIQRMYCYLKEKESKIVKKDYDLNNARFLVQRLLRTKKYKTIDDIIKDSEIHFIIPKHILEQLKKEMEE